MKTKCTIFKEEYFITMPKRCPHCGNPFSGHPVSIYFHEEDCIPPSEYDDYPTEIHVGKLILTFFHEISSCMLPFVTCTKVSINDYGLTEESCPESYPKFDVDIPHNLKIISPRAYDNFCEAYINEKGKRLNSAGAMYRRALECLVNDCLEDFASKMKNKDESLEQFQARVKDSDLNKKIEMLRWNELKEFMHGVRKLGNLFVHDNPSEVTEENIGLFTSYFKMISLLYVLKSKKVAQSAKKKDDNSGENVVSFQNAKKSAKKHSNKILKDGKSNK